MCLLLHTTVMSVSQSMEISSIVLDEEEIQPRDESLAAVPRESPHSFSPLCCVAEIQEHLLDPLLLSPKSRRAEYECCCCFNEYNLRSHPPIISSLCSHSVCIHCVEKIWKRNLQQYLSTLPNSVPFLS